MNDNDKKLRELLTEEPVPQELEPENIKKMLDEKVPARKRNKIKRSMALRITAGAAACAVVGTTAVHFAGQRNVINKNKSVINSEYEKVTNSVKDVADGEKYELKTQAPYMSGASDYSEVYKLFKDSTKDPVVFTEETVDAALGGEEFYDEAESVDNSIKGETPTEVQDDAELTDAPVFSENEDDDDYSETYNQEEGVLEADIVKTDGKCIYYIYNNYNYGNYNEDGIYENYSREIPLMNVTAVDNGTFTSSEKIDLRVDADSYFGGGFDASYCYVQDMYVYNDMLLVVGSISAEKWVYFDENSKRTDDVDMDGDYFPDCLSKEAVFVSVYTTGESPQLLDTYYQEGSYEDVRISPDGYMYLISDYFTQSTNVVENENELENYVPTCGINDKVSYIPAEDILLPAESENKSDRLSYTVIGSLDLNTSGEITAVDSKALAGYTGQIYCSQDNLYTNTYSPYERNDEESLKTEKTNITRIAINAGTITPAASGTIDGTVKDQFSMSEYNGYFRVAAHRQYYYYKFVPYDNYEINEDDDAIDSWGDVLYGDWKGDEFGRYYFNTSKIDNCVYVLDLDMNIVGESEAFGQGESIKSASFSGDISYVVTYEQTDPLFAIDLSDPTAPAIMDEFKILGYSTYMQQWNDGQLLGFGIAADEDGIERGIKLTMFDNSDPYNLQAIDTFELIRGEEQYIGSDAVWDRKALLIAPEKNLIGFPLYRYNYGEEDWNMSEQYAYMFFSFEDGKFVYRGEFVNNLVDYNTDIYNFTRAVYIGDYVYIISGSNFIAVDINTMEKTDEVFFD
ncbi:MAG: beta-propeller domain-containing protein [Ruminococcus sp.]|nr:beta-propeller domain-containing protein [Ruminococcus sp.]